MISIKLTFPNKARELRGGRRYIGLLTYVDWLHIGLQKYLLSWQKNKTLLKSFSHSGLQASHYLAFLQRLTKHYTFVCLKSADQLCVPKHCVYYSTALGPTDAFFYPRLIFHFRYNLATGRRIPL